MGGKRFSEVVAEEQKLTGCYLGSQVFLHDNRLGEEVSRLCQFVCLVSKARVDEYIPETMFIRNSVSIDYILQKDLLSPLPKVCDDKGC